MTKELKLPDISRVSDYYLRRVPGSWVSENSSDLDKLTEEEHSWVLRQIDDLNTRNMNLGIWGSALPTLEDLLSPTYEEEQEDIDRSLEDILPEVESAPWQDPNHPIYWEKPPKSEEK